MSDQTETNVTEGNLFKGDAEPTPTQEPETPETGATEKAGTNEPVLVYGDRVFSSKEDILKKMVNADAFIDQLKEENQALRSEVEQLTNKIQELQTMFETQKNDPAIAQEELPTQQVDNQPTNAVPQEELAKVVEQLLEQKQRQTVLQKNIEEAKQMMLSKYGEKAEEVVLSKAEELGMSVQQVEQLAATSPKAFQRLLLDGEDNKPASSLGATLGTKANATAVTTSQPEQKTPLYKLKGKELQQALAERAKRIAEEKGIPLV